MVAPYLPKPVASGPEVISKEVEEGKALNVKADFTIFNTDKADSSEDLDEPELINSNDLKDPQQVEENYLQDYSSLNELEDEMEEGSEIILDDLSIDALMADETKPLSIEQAQELIPEGALKLLKEKFNGHIEYCRPIHDRDRLI